MNSTSNSTNSTTADCSVTIELPSDERSWYVYIIASCAIYVSGFICILIGRVFWKVFKKWQFKLPEDEKDSRKPMEEYKAWYLQLKEFAVNLDTGKSVLGKCLVRIICFECCFEKGRTLFPRATRRTWPTPARAFRAGSGSA